MSDTATSANQWPFKGCSGAHCHVRDACLHHALPTDKKAASLVYPAHPIYRAEDCRWFDEKAASWGVGSETPDHD